MRYLLCLALPSAGLALGAADTPRPTPEAQLQRALAGLTPGATTDCLPPYRRAQSTGYGSTIVYTVSRGLKYRSDTSGSCASVGRGDVLVTRTTIGRVCRGDIAQTFDPVSRIPTGSCTFGSFTEYRK
jgi:hypothetical protein